MNTPGTTAGSQQQLVSLPENSYWPKHSGSVKCAICGMWVNGFKTYWVKHVGRLCWGCLQRATDNSELSDSGPLSKSQ